MNKSFEIDNYHISTIIIKNEVDKLLNKIENKEKLMEEDFVRERKILKAARKYEIGEFENCDYMEPNNAYNLLVSIIQTNTRYTVETFTTEIERQMDEIINNNYENYNLITLFLRKIQCEMKKKEMEIDYSRKRHEVSYGIFDI